jgi:hypothetical protein
MALLLAIVVLVIVSVATALAAPPDPPVKFVTPPPKPGHDGPPVAVLPVIELGVMVVVDLAPGP